MSKSIDVAEIVETGCFLIKRSSLSSYMYLNGKQVDTTQDLYFGPEDSIKLKPYQKTLLYYKRGETKITIEEYNSKPQIRYEGDSDETVLRKIANKKELEGFEPVYDDKEFEDITFNVTKYVIDTGSKFITCTPRNTYQTEHFIYTVYVRSIAMDEYLTLSGKYSSIANFEKPDRTYLRFTQINKNYVFSDSKPFGDFGYNCCFVSLEQAKKEEEETREAVRKVVNRSIFKKEGTSFYLESIISKLDTAKTVPTKKACNEILTSVISEIKEYIGRC